MTEFQQFVERWRGCKKCPLHETRHSVVLARGTVPASVMFLGESPGKGEDTLGLPFVGVSGKLLDTIIARSLSEGVTYCLTNIVSCLPLDEDGNKTSEPDPAEIVACSQRLQEFVEIARPKLVVCVGALASKWLDRVLPHRQIPGCHITHPAAILRMPFVNRGLAVQKAQVILSEAVETYILNPKGATSDG